MSKVPLSQCTFDHELRRYVVEPGLDPSIYNDGTRVVSMADFSEDELRERFRNGALSREQTTIRAIFRVKGWKLGATGLG